LEKNYYISNMKIMLLNWKIKEIQGQYELEIEPIKMENYIRELHLSEEKKIIKPT
jgi:hypothetical protein